MDVNHCSKKGHTAVYEAACHGGREAVLAMLKHGSHALDLDSSHGVGLSARDIITEHYPDLKSILPLPRIKHHHTDGHTQLLAAYQHRQLNAFHNILCQVNSYGNACINPNFWYSKPYNSTCLEVACKEIGCEEFVRALLLAGADPNTVNTVTHKSPLHLTAETGNYEAMKILLEARQVNVNMADGHGRTALHTAMEQHRGNNEDGRRLLQCISLLLEQESIDLNRTDNNGYSAIDLAAIRNDSDAVLLMLKHHGLELDVNGFQATQNLTKSEIMTEQLLGIKRALSQKGDAENHENILKDTLFQHLYKRESQEFIRIFKENVNKHATLVVQEFDDKHCTCLQYASNYGLQDVVKVLLEYDADPNATTDHERRPPIVLACIRQNQDILQNFLDLPPESNFNINATDAKGNTALHYAVQNENIPSVIALLNHGADIKIRNIFDWPPLPAEAAGRLFNHCLQTSHHFPDDKDYEIIFDYGLLLASNRHENVGTAMSTDTSHHATENQDLESLQDRRKVKPIKPEMNLLLYLSQSQEYRHLLSHPIITSFLHLKWFRIRAIYYTNLALYVLLLILLNIYIFMDNRLLDSNPTFMNVSTHNISDGKNTSEGEHQETHLERFWTTYKNLIWFLLLFVLFCHAVREQFKFVVSPAKYLLTLDSMLDLALVFTTTTVLLKSWDEDYHRKLITASSLFLSWVELALIMGRLPNLSVNIEMLKSVVRHYTLILSSYFFFVTAFAVTFHIFYHDYVGHDSDAQTFQTPWAAVKNTVMLMTGGIHVLSGNGYSSIVLLLFVFIVVMVMSNILMGTAVFDVRTIHENAEMLRAVSRITLLYEIESVLTYWNTFMEKICQFNCASKMAAYLNNALKRVMLFPNTNTTSDKKMSVLPNKSASIIFNNKENSVTCKMNTKILQAAINTISNQADMNIKYKMKS